MHDDPRWWHATDGGVPCRRIEDHDDLTHICSEQTKALTGSYGPYFLAELIEAQDEENHAAVCEVSDANGSV